MPLADSLQRVVIDLLTELRTPELIPADVTFHTQRETGTLERPVLIALCADIQNRHTRHAATTFILRARTRPAQNEETPGSEAAAFSAWHSAAVMLLIGHLDLLADRLAALGYRLTVFTPSGQLDQEDGDAGWTFEQHWDVEAILLRTP